MDVKACTKCGETKPVEAFYKRGDGFRYTCKECDNAYTQAQRAANPEKLAASYRDYYRANRERILARRRDRREITAANRRKWQYGISPARFAALVNSQDGVCAICGEVDEKENLSIDHDHSCCASIYSCGNCVRGLLCRRCNAGLGCFRDSDKLLGNAISYVSSFRDG